MRKLKYFILIFVILFIVSCSNENSLEKNNNILKETNKFSVMEDQNAELEDEFIDVKDNSKYEGKLLLHYQQGFTEVDLRGFKINLNTKDIEEFTYSFSQSYEGVELEAFSNNHEKVIVVFSKPENDETTYGFGIGIYNIKNDTFTETVTFYESDYHSIERLRKISWYSDDQIFFLLCYDLNLNYRNVCKAHTIFTDGSNLNEIDINLENLSSIVWSNNYDYLGVRYFDSDNDIKKIMLFSKNQLDQPYQEINAAISIPYEFSWSPTDNEIAFSGKDEKENFPEVYLYRLKPNSIEKITSNEIDEVFKQLIWSPDGNWIAYTITTNIYPEIWIMSVDGQYNERIYKCTYLCSLDAWIDE